MTNQVYCKIVVPDPNTEEGKTKGCQSFKYSRSIIRQDGTCSSDIVTKIGCGKQATETLHGLIWSKTLSEKNKKTIFLSIVRNIISYGVEAWPMATK